MKAIAYVTAGLLLLAGIVIKNFDDLPIALLMVGLVPVAIIVRGYLLTRPNDERFDYANQLGRKCAIGGLLLAFAAPMFFDGIDQLPPFGFVTFLPGGYVVGVAIGLLKKRSI